MAEQISNITMQRVWQEITEKSGKHAGVQELLNRFDTTAADGILRELTLVEADALVATDPLLFLRKAIADLIDRKMSSEKLYRMSRPSAGEEAEDPSMQSLSLVATDYEIQIAVLRVYCRRRFGDGHERDWFAAYVELSAFFHERMGEERTAVHPEPGFHFDGSDWKIDRGTFQECRERCFTAPVHKRFEPLKVSKTER